MILKNVEELESSSIKIDKLIIIFTHKIIITIV